MVIYTIYEFILLKLSLGSLEGHCFLMFHNIRIREKQYHRTDVLLSTSLLKSVVVTQLISLKY